MAVLSAPFWLLALAQTISSFPYMFDGIPGPSVDQVAVNMTVLSVILIALGGAAAVSLGFVRRAAQLTLTVSGILLVLVSIPVAITLSIVAHQTLSH